MLNHGPAMPFSGVAISFFIGCAVFASSDAIGQSDCPPPVQQFSKTVINDTKIKVGKLGGLSAGEIETKTKVAVDNLMKNVPNLDKSLYCQGVQSVACQIVRDVKDATEKSKIWNSMLTACNQIMGAPGADAKPAARTIKVTAKEEQTSKYIARAIVTIRTDVSAAETYETDSEGETVISLPPTAGNVTLEVRARNYQCYQKQLQSYQKEALIVFLKRGACDKSASPVPAPVVAPPSLTARPGPDQNVPVGTVVTLDGSGSAKTRNKPLTYEWTLLSKPVGSLAAIAGPRQSRPTLTVDKAGEYVVTLSTSNGKLTSKPAATTVSAPMITPLGYRPVDAKFNRKTNTIVMVSAEPNRLHVYDPLTGSDKAVALPLAPSAVSIEPDGMFAAVGHSGWISYVSLSALKIEKTLTVSTDVLDLVLGGNEYVYAFPRRDQWENIYSVNLQSDAEYKTDNASIYAGTRVELHPAGDFIYGATNGISPSKIEKYDITAGPAQFLYQMPYHGDHETCGRLWFSSEGKRIFTRCGNVFRSSPLQTEDMIFNGALQGVDRIAAFGHSQIGGKVAVIPEAGTDSSSSDADRTIRFYEDKFLAFNESIKLPRFQIGGKLYGAHGRYIFASTTGDKYFVIVQADAASGAIQDYGIVTY